MNKKSPTILIWLATSIKTIHMTTALQLRALFCVIMGVSLLFTHCDEDARQGTTSQVQNTMGNRRQ